MGGFLLRIGGETFTIAMVGVGSICPGGCCNHQKLETLRFWLVSCWKFLFIILFLCVLKTAGFPSEFWPCGLIFSGGCLT